jgi:DNA-binding NarL/FixJ family response regulator
VPLLVAAGQSNLEIAASLHVSVHTVKTQLKSILRKLGMQSRWQVRDAFASGRLPELGES